MESYNELISRIKAKEYSKKHELIKRYRYIIAYFALIPIYAIIYSTFPKEFQNSNIVRQSKEKEEQLSNKLAILIRSNIKSVYKDSIIQHGEATIPIEWITAKYLGTKVDSTIFELEFTVQHNDYNYKNNFHINPRLKDSFTIMEETMKESKLVYFLCKVEVRVLLRGDKYFRIISYDKVNIEDKNCFPISFTDLFASNVPTLTIGYIDYYTIDMSSGINFTEEINDFIESNSSFYNMLYISAITITTVGFGDVVPITHKSRFWVMTEAILGAFLIGFFFYSIAKGIKSN